MGTNLKKIGVISTITPKKKVVFTLCTLHTISFFFSAIMDTKKHEQKQMIIVKLIGTIIYFE